jgi:hypothetical protein
MAQCPVVPPRLNDDRPTRAEAAALTPICVLAAVVAGAYIGDLAGQSITPARVAPVAALIAIPVCIPIWRRARSDGPGFAAWAVTGVGMFAWLCAMAWPTLLPLGSGPDLVHHLGLIRYIETHHHLVHDPAVEHWLGEMVGYTPGCHVLIVLASQLAGTDGLRAAHPLVASAVALKIGLVVLIALRAARSGGWSRIAAGAAAAVLLLMPRVYVIGSFTHDSYFAQVVAETFAVAGWWALVAWDARPSKAVLAVFALCGAATFLTWPIWIGPLLLTFAVLVAVRPGLRVAERAIALALGAGPVAVVAAAYLVGRFAWTGIVKTSGAVQVPSPASIGWTLTILAAAGLVLAGRERRVRATTAALGAIALQAGALYLVAKSNGADTPYMAYKMAYLAVYPLAVLAALAIDALAGLAAVRASRMRWSHEPWLAPVIGATAVVCLAVLAVRSHQSARAPRPAVSLGMQQAAQWLRARRTADCVDYVTRDWVSAYWLHTVELGHPRMSARTQDITDRFDPRAVVGRWADPRGDFQFAIVEDLEQVPTDARVNMETLARFGPAAVVRRRQAARCKDDGQPAA